MDARYVQLHLRRCGVVVHHAAGMPTTSDGRRAVVVFLEAGLQQFELARRCALRLPGVIDVAFSGHTATIMYVYGAAPGGRSTPRRSPTPPSPAPVRTKRAPGPVKSPATARRRTTARQQN